MSPERLGRFFDQEDGGYRIKKSLRDVVVFAEQDLIADPPFSKVDLISCRNLLIYMGGELQRKVLPLFHYALNQDGYLFLGNVESVGEFGDLFAAVDRKWKIFQRRGAVGVRRGAIEFPTLARGVEVMRRREGAGVGAEEQPDVRQAVEQVLLGRHTPACVLVNESGAVLYIHGRAGRYLEPASGEASLNILRMAGDGLSAALRSFCAEFSRREKTQVQFLCRGEQCPLPQEVALCVYRVAQEALHNAARHSGSARVPLGASRELLARGAGR